MHDQRETKDQLSQQLIDVRPDVASVDGAGNRAGKRELLAVQAEKKGGRARKSLSARSRFLLLTFIMIMASGVGMGIMTTMLYRHNFAEHSEQLRATVQSQARLIEAIARHDSVYERNTPGGPVKATISQIIDAHERYKGFGETGEFTLARHEGDQIIYIMRHRFGTVKQPPPVAYHSELAEPMRLALQGQSGTVICLDNRGVTVLAAYEPVAVLNLGIVAKIELAEIRTPFIKSGLSALAFALLFILAGTLLFFRIGNPMIARLETHARELEKEIEERKQAEEDRKRLELHIRHHQRLESIGTLASGVAHEINNPISGIMNYAELIRMDLQEGNPLKEYAVEIGKESERVATIVRNLLTFSRDEKETHSPTVVEDIVNETLSLVQAVLRHDQITLEVDVPANLPKINCRSQQIQQVLMNLITNARDALNERYPEYDENKRLIVRVRPVEKEGLNWIRLTIEDHGAGIPEDVRNRIFDPFFTTKDRTQGTGLGLSVSYGIVEEHRGEMSVDSEVGQYTRIHVDLRVDNGWTPGGPDQTTGNKGN